MGLQASPLPRPLIDRFLCSRRRTRWAESAPWVALKATWSLTIR